MTSEKSAATSVASSEELSPHLSPRGKLGQDNLPGDNLPQQTGRRKPRRAIFISEVDRHLIDIGEAPSWEQKVSSADLEQSSSGTGGHNTSNDQRLQENIPPHSHSRI